MTAATMQKKLTTREELLAAYKTLKPSERSVLQALSVMYVPLARTTLLRYVNQASLKTEKGVQYNAVSWKKLLTKLRNKGLVDESGREVYCREIIVEDMTRAAVRAGTFSRLAAAVRRVVPLRKGWSGGVHFSDITACFQEIRLALYAHDLDALNLALSNYYENYGWADPLNPWELICNRPFDAEWFSTLPNEIFPTALHSVMQEIRDTLGAADKVFALVEKQRLTEPKDALWLRFCLVDQYMLRGDFADAKKLIERADSAASDSVKGWLHFLRGEDKKAIVCYEAGLRLIKKGSGKRKVFFEGFSGVFFIFALIRTGDAARLTEAANYLAIATKDDNHQAGAIYDALKFVVALQQGKLREAEKIIAMARFLIEGRGAGEYLEGYTDEYPGERSDIPPLHSFFVFLAWFWISPDAAKVAAKPLSLLLKKASANGYRWLAAEIAELLAQLGAKGKYAEQAKSLRGDDESVSLVRMIKSRTAWERSLDALMHLDDKSIAPTPKATAQTRLIWHLIHEEGGEFGTHIALRPLEQKLGKSGKWTKGRNVALKRLYENRDTMDFLTAQDRKVCTAISSHMGSSGYGYYGRKVIFEIELDDAFPALVGHPLVFAADTPGVRLDITAGELELLVVQKGKNFHLQLSPAISAEDTGTLITREGPTRLKVIPITKEYRQIAELLGEAGLRVPSVAKDQVLATLGSLAGIVTVQSEIGGGVAAKEVPTDSRPRVHLLPSGAGLTVEMLIQPLPGGGPCYSPGQGAKTVFAEIGGTRYQTDRDLKEEKKQAEAVITACPALARERSGMMTTGGGEVWSMEEPETCLEALLELQALGEAVVVAWPQGERFKVRPQAGLDQLRLNIRHQRDWFSLTGELRLDDDLVLDMKKLIALVKETPGRFLPLENGEFLALTKEFRQRLGEIDAFTEPHGKGARLHALAAPLLEELSEEVGTLRADRQWKDHVKRLQEAGQYKAVIPTTFQAELRDYQIEGFRWLARLAHWGAGACLADDMGLGKTIEALALILTRASAGPTLVVAPASVGMNWETEAARFAPTLRVIVFGAGDRQATLKNLQPLDLVVCSYGLLQQEAKLLADTAWETIVLDEAQAIKNPAAKRSQAAMTLQGKFKMITTGTPIENHLGELWNLFRFINPGLLGSRERFNERFATPIERDHDRNVRQQLKKLIQPFILRRLKSQVLTELPPRTEIVLHVELSAQERALYEALREQAVTNIEGLGEDENAGGKHLKILAEIMRLRRACCHPRLVAPEISLPGAKLEVFGDTLDELLAGRHKALVFSQFVDHLTIIREYLDKRGIRYQYLDGSTPTRQRAGRVQAFQAGEGDVFLISLKAGGVGLNLTAADYVIHMDPWWNPAVEDQASDRAHRIGQKRPVTVYRLITRHTIEEKIVALHQEKRALADGLLEGSDMSGKLSAVKLLRLLQDS